MRSFKPVVFFTLLVLAGFFAAGAVSRLQRTPRLEISPEFDVGELVHDQELNLAIGFRNGGNGMLHVEPPIPGCNCAKATLEHSDFAPGETGVFRFTLRPANAPGAEYRQPYCVSWPAWPNCGQSATGCQFEEWTLMCGAPVGVILKPLCYGECL